MKYLFPPEQLRAVVVQKITIEDEPPEQGDVTPIKRGTSTRKRKTHKGETIIFHRADSAIEYDTWLAKGALIKVAGLAVTDAPAFNLFDMTTNRRPGFFTFKGAAALPRTIKIKSSLSLKIIQAGVVLGEAYAKRERNEHRIVTGKDVEMLHQRVACWLLYDYFSSAEFLAQCQSKGVLPLDEAAEAMGRTEYKIRPDALRQQWRRLNLPMLGKIAVK